MLCYPNRIKLFQLGRVSTLAVAVSFHLSPTTEVGLTRFVLFWLCWAKTGVQQEVWTAGLR